MASLLLMEGSMSWCWSNSSEEPLGFASAVRKNALHFLRAERFLLIGCHAHKSDAKKNKPKNTDLGYAHRLGKSIGVVLVYCM